MLSETRANDTAQVSSRRAEPDAIVGAIRAVVGDKEARVGLHEPEFAGREWDYVKDCLDSTYVSYVGAYVSRFEEMLAAATGAAFAVAMVNGTAALQIALLLAGVKPGDEVIVPALTFVGSANAVVHAGGVPHFADSEFGSLGLDPHRLGAYLEDILAEGDDGPINRLTGRRIAAILPVHILGHPVDLDGLRALTGRYGIALVEDIAEALGSAYRGKGIAAETRLGALSFNGNKIVTTGGGGAIVTDNAELARRARHLTTTAKLPHAWAFVHDEVGYNLRMPNLNAALGCAQMERLGEFVAHKRALARGYEEAFAGVPGVRLIREPAPGTSNYWLNAILLDEEDVSLRDAVLQAAHSAGLMVRPAWTLMHKLPMYEAMPRAALPVAESIERRLIKLPSSARLGAAL